MLPRFATVPLTLATEGETQENEELENATLQICARGLQSAASVARSLFSKLESVEIY